MKCKLRGLRMNIVNTGQIVNNNNNTKKKKAYSTVSGNDNNMKEDSQHSIMNRLNRTAQSDNNNKNKIDIYDNNNNELNLETFDPYIEYNDAPNCLGFIILSICKNIQINAIQAASLLANGNKYFNQLLIRGKKGIFQPIISLLSDVYKYVHILIKLIEQEESQGSVKFILQVLKGIYHSNNIDVCKIGCRIYSKILYDLANRDYLSDAWEW